MGKISDELDKHLLDKFMERVLDESRAQTAALQSLRNKIKPCYNDKRAEKLDTEKDEITELARDGGGDDYINPKLAFALDFLDNEGIPSLESAKSRIVDLLNDLIEEKENETKELSNVIKQMVKGQFFYDGHSSDDNDDDDYRELTEENIEEMVQNWKDLGYSTKDIKTMERQARLRAGL